MSTLTTTKKPAVIAYCPICSDRNSKTVTISPSRQTFSCSSCGVGGILSKYFEESLLSDAEPVKD